MELRALRFMTVCVFVLGISAVVYIYVYWSQQVEKGFVYSISVTPYLDSSVCMIKSAIHSKGLADLRWSISQTPCVPISHKFDVLFFCCCKLRYFFISVLSANQCKKRKMGG